MGPDGLHEYDITGLADAEPTLEPLGHITVTPPAGEPEEGTSDGVRG